MIWSRQATSHYLSQCWPEPIVPYGVTRPQWLESMLIRIGNTHRNIENLAQIRPELKSHFIPYAHGTNFNRGILLDLQSPVQNKYGFVLGERNASKFKLARYQFKTSDGLQHIVTGPGVVFYFASLTRVSWFFCVACVLNKTVERGEVYEFAKRTNGKTLTTVKKTWKQSHRSPL